MGGGMVGDGGNRERLRQNVDGRWWIQRKGGDKALVEQIGKTAKLHGRNDGRRNSVREKRRVKVEMKPHTTVGAGDPQKSGGPAAEAAALSLSLFNKTITGFCRSILIIVLGWVVGKEGLFEGKSTARASKRADSGDESLERQEWTARPLRRSSQ
ncbi:hypothetical protein PIB30_008708 [Stylosanthes scabra]|uniref:Uncharacterized protein n=1 Tax=Stylosanthes scabra TaxID=79078 RepID=A0ABU6U3R8_9FABA|nr:hypothetical protein [Stylosanthes scabra]